MYYKDRLPARGIGRRCTIASLSTLLTHPHVRAIGHRAQLDLTAQWLHFVINLTYLSAYGLYNDDMSLCKT